MKLSTRNLLPILLILVALVFGGIMACGGGNRLPPEPKGNCAAEVEVDGDTALIRIKRGNVKECDERGPYDLSVFSEFLQQFGVIGPGRALYAEGKTTLKATEGTLVRETITANGGSTIVVRSDELGENEYIIRPMPDGEIGFYPWEPDED